MFLDNNLVFSDGQSLITNTTTRSTYIIDLIEGKNSGSTYNTTPKLAWSPNQTYFGQDLGIGKEATPRVVGSVGTAFITANSATLNVAFQGGPDPGTGTVSDIVFATYIETGELAASVLTANTQVFAYDIPRRKVAAAMPRFLALSYQLPNSTAFTVGTIKAFMLIDDDQFASAQYGSGFVVAG